MRHLLFALTLTLSVFSQTIFGQEQTSVLHEFARNQLTDVYFSEGISVGDINADGHNDVVYGPYWFVGPDFDVKHELYPAKPQPMEGYTDHFFSWVYDFDGNGASDVLTVGFPGTPAYVYENPGKGVGKWTKHEVLDWVSNESPQWTNLVGDERPELVCTRDGFFGFATVDWSKPFSNWTFHPISEQVTAAKFGHGLGIGDVNRDGRQDILHSGGWYEQPESGALDGRWQPHQVKFTSAYGGAEMYAYDVDGDGDNDVITSEAAHEYGLSWYEQTAPDAFKRHGIMGANPSENKYGVLFTELHSVNLADIDGDGLKDIVTGKTYWSHHKQSPLWDAGAVVYWFKLVRNEDGVDWLPFQIDGKSGIGRQIVVADIDADGNLDVATGGMLGASVLTQVRKSVTRADFDAAQPKIYTGPKLTQVENAAARRGPRSIIGPDGTAAEAIEGEALNATVSGGKASPQSMAGFSGDTWSGKSQLWWTGAKPGDTLSIELDAFQDIEAIELVMTCARDYGFVQVLLDGEPLGDPIDLFETEVITTGLLEFATPNLKQGKHKLVFELVGANAKAVKSYMFGLDYIRFRGKGQTFDEPVGGIKAKSADGRVLNLDFETGTLADWTAEGSAFEGQPIEGDTVSQRRQDMRSRHVGQYWIGSYERMKDAAVGTLTSAPFQVDARFGSFWIAGGNSDATRVDLVVLGEEKPFFSISGRQTEDMERVVVDLRRAEGREMVIRIVDSATDDWGHINFDHFRLHMQRPGPVTPPRESLVNDEYPFSGLDAEKAASAMQVPEGFSVTVCAAEPDVKQPIAMAIDDRGRTWIAEAYEYPQRAEGDQGRDRILIFEDTKGDGRFDSRKVFAEGLNLVSGLEVGFGGVWVGAAPYLLFIPDANSDDVPDAEPTILLDGWGFHDTHETLNAFCWGPDGWLYGCHGVFTHSKVGKPGTPDAERTPLNAGVWRYHPTRHEFEVFAHGTSNPWGVDFNEHGEAFVTACVIPHLYHMIPGARYERQAGEHFNKNTYDDIKTIADHLHYLGATPHSGNGKSDEAGGGHAHAGAMIYQGGLWPEKYRGALLMNNIHGQRLNTDLLVPQGSGYVGTHAPDFLLTGDMASQILNMRYGPDGNVIMIDWYDMQACHRREVEVHDRSNGRIYKISYKGEGQQTTLSFRDLATASDLELAEMCLDSNDWYVKHSRRLLQERATERKISQEAIKRLVEIATTHMDDSRRLRAMWARHAIGIFDPSLFTQLEQDPSPHVRGWSIRLKMQQSDNQLNTQQLASLTAMAESDPSPVVRRAIASAADRLPAKVRWEIVSALAQHAEDANDHNLPLMYWYVMEPLAEVDPDRALALGINAGQHIPVLREYMLRRVAGSGGEEAINRLVAGLQKSQAPELQLTYLKAIRTALVGQRSAKKPTQWDGLYEQLRVSPSSEVTLQAAALGLSFGDAAAESKLIAMLMDEGSEAQESHRLEAMNALLAAKVSGLHANLVSLATSGDGQPSAVRLAAIRGLAQYDDATTGRELLGVYSKLDADGRRAAIATLCSRVDYATALLRAIGAKEIAASDLSADLARQLEYLENSEVTQLLADVWGQVRESSADKAEMMDKYKQLLARSDLPAADTSFGRSVFAKTCQRCHVLFGEGEKLGPDLTGSNRANLDYLLENIVDPSAVMANEYRQSVFLTEDGQVITGIVRAETENAVTVQTAETTVILPKDEIIQRKASEQSMMPENQLAQFSEHEIRSLIAYLRTKTQVPLPQIESPAAE